MAFTEQTLSSELVFDGRLLKIYRDDVTLSDGTPTIREVVRHPGGAAVVALDNSGNVHLVRQFRYPYAKEVLEIPAGKLEPDEDPLTTIQRELMEEVGATAAVWTPLGRFFPTPGYTDELLHLYLAQDMTFGQAHLDEGEFLEHVAIPFHEAVQMAGEGRLEDAKTVIGLLMADRILSKK